MFLVRVRNRSPFKDIHDITVLEKIEAELSELEPSYDNKEKRFYLYLRWQELEPKETHFTYSISKLVLDLGWDLKRQKVNYELAQLYFEELIRANKPRLIPLAHYRLGFIHFYNKKYRKSIQHFERALLSLTRKPEFQPHPHEKLNPSQKWKAQVQLATALHKYSEESAFIAKQMYEDLENPDESDIDFLTKLEKVIQIDEHPPYTCLTPNGRHSLSEQDYRELKNDETSFILDCTNDLEKRVIINGAAHRLSPRRMEILEMLFRKQRPVPQRELGDELGIAQVSRAMNDLRGVLFQYGLPQQTIIAENGYRIDHPKHFFIYKADDPKYIM